MQPGPHEACLSTPQGRWEVDGDGERVRAPVPLSPSRKPRGSAPAAAACPSSGHLNPSAQAEGEGEEKVKGIWGHRARPGCAREPKGLRGRVPAPEVPRAAVGRGRGGSRGGEGEDTGGGAHLDQGRHGHPRALSPSPPAPCSLRCRSSSDPLWGTGPSAPEPTEPFQQDMRWSTQRTWTGGATGAPCSGLV